jgi:type IV secretory pathway VirB10-like protein
MDILAGMFAYLAGIGAVIAALAISFSVLLSQPNQAVQPQNQAQSATAMVVKQAQPNKAAPVEANSKPMSGHAKKQAAMTSAPAAAQPTPSAKDQRKAIASAAKLRRLVQEERARHWAYQQDSRQDSRQDSSFQSRFLGYAD